MKRRTAIAAAVAALVLTVGYIALDPFTDSVGAQNDGASDDGAEPAAKLKTSEVLVETLMSSEDYNGNLGFGVERTLSALAVGTLTWVPEEETILRPGDILWEVDRQPVVYIEGSIPMYRELFSGVKKGDDVLQLEQYLIATGYGPEGWEADESFNGRTRDAVKAFQKDHGMTQSGSIGPDRVVVGTEPLRVASTATLGSPSTAGPVLTVTDAEAKVTISATSRQLPSFQRSPDVTIVLSNSDELAAVLDETKATPADEQGRFGYSLTYVVTGALGEAQPVKVRLEHVLAEDALTVPVDALVALAEGGYAVEVQTASGPVLRAVEVIDFDDTRVAITGDLQAGDRVVIP